MSAHTHEKHSHSHDLHSHEVSSKTVTGLWISFVINMLLSVIEIVFGLIAGSISLIADALHNTSDAFSILIALIAYKIGTKKANKKYSYGFKRAETIGGFVNLILLFISGGYLLFEGVLKIISPEEINGRMIVYVSILALIIDVITAKLSHHDAAHNGNMKMLFIHNLADALGSVGVIVSGLFVIYLQWNFVDGIVAVTIALYMIIQAVLSFRGIVDILMNAAPEGLDSDLIAQKIMTIDGVCDVHDLHLWQIDEHRIGFECHIVASNMDLTKTVRQMLADEFAIKESIIQIEETSCSKECCH